MTTFRSSGIQWAAQVPSTWAVGDLMWCCSERKVRNTGNLESNVLSLSYGRIIRRDVESHHGLLPESFETYQVVEPGNVILRLTDLQNDKHSLRTGLARERGVITSAYVVLEPGPTISPRFLHYLLHSYDVSKVFYGFGGGVRQSMKFDDLKHLPLVLPPDAKQRAIADFLDRKTAAIDALIEKKQRMLDLLTEKRAALINQAVTKGLDPGVPMKDSGIPWIGEIPAHWNATQPRYVCTKIVDGPHVTPDYVDEGVPFVTVKNLTAGPGISFSDVKYITPELHSQLSRRAKAERGDILISKDGATLGVPRVVETDDEFSFFVSVALLKVKGDRFDSTYLRYALETDSTWQQFKCGEAGSGLKHIVLRTIGNVIVPSPPRDEQVLIARHLQEALREMESLQRSSERSVATLQEYRQALITAAVTGQIDIGKVAA